MSKWSSTSMTKSMTDTESILRSVEISVSGLSATPFALKGLRSLHRASNVSSRSVMKRALLHRFGTGSIGDRRTSQPSVLAIPGDGSGESLRERNLRRRREIAFPANPIGMIELPHLVRRQEQGRSRKSCRDGDRNGSGEEQRARQIDRHDAAALGFGCDRHQLG